MIDDDKEQQTHSNVIYDESHQFRAVRTDELSGFFEQDELIWQAQYFGSSYHEDGWERGGYYATPEKAIEAAKRAKYTNEFLTSFIEGNE